MAISWAYGLAAPSRWRPWADASSGIASPPCSSSAWRSDVRPSRDAVASSSTCSCSQRVIRYKGLVLVQDIFWIVWLRRHSEGVKLVSFFSPVVIPRLQKQRGERANQHSALPRLSRDRDKSRERGVDRSTRGLAQNVSLAPDRRAVSHCRGRTLSGRRLLYPSERRTMCGPLF